ncbi:hypothetical protein Pmani_025613 [Petrolisthes manimaculis]|uniref:Uncharacterized protein n=1 Tax=Petrolisthes manimaculis TaxID=1843537 RepID=A0AAE1P6D5_9EUCA|nr:hypothetical protein Pmani_025613 [Petrolisthes manimaculis]
MGQPTNHPILVLVFLIFLLVFYRGGVVGVLLVLMYMDVIVVVVKAEGERDVVVVVGMKSPFNHTLCCLGPRFTDAYKVLSYLLSGPSPVTPPPGPRLRRRPIGYWLWSTFMVPRRASPCLTPLFFYTSQHRMS